MASRWALPLLGAALLGAGTLLHPMQADPNVPEAAFAEYAADRHWVASHLMQLVGAAALVSSLVLFAKRLEAGPAAQWARVGTALGIATIAATGVLQAVDGIALKAMVDRWALASEPDKAALFAAALGVRQIEIGLAGIASLLLGLTAVIVGIGLLIDAHFPTWIGLIGIAAGVSTALSGVAIAYTGFSDLAMTTNMPGALAIMAWIIALGAFSQRST